MKEEQRKKILDEKKIENIIKARENAEKVKQKVDKTLSYKEEKLQKQREVKKNNL